MIEKYLLNGISDFKALKELSSHCFVSQNVLAEAHSFLGIKLFGEYSRTIEFIFSPQVCLDGFKFAFATDICIDEFGSLYSHEEVLGMAEVAQFNGFSSYLSQPGDVVIGHWIFQHLPKAWFISNTLQGCPIRFLMHKRAKPMFKAFLPFLSQMKGFNGGFFLDSKPTKLDGLVYSDVFSIGNRLVGSVYGQFRSWILLELDKIKEQRVKNKCHYSFPEKIFFSRGKWKSKTRKLINREEVERAFEAEGYSIISPEEYDVIDLLIMLTECKFIAGERGSALHLSAFTRGVRTVIVLCYNEDKNGMWPAQAAIGTACNQNTFFVFGQGKQTGKDSNDFEYFIRWKDVKDAIRSCDG